MITYQFKLRPNREQETALWKTLKGSREIYNQCLAELIEHYEKTGKHMTLFSQDKKHSSANHPGIPAVVVDETLKRLHRAFSDFFRRCKDGSTKKGFPRFKGITRWNSMGFRDSKSNGITGSYFKGGKLLGGFIRFNRHREINGSLKFCRILRKPSGWYLQAVCENTKVDSPKTGLSVGLDFGIKHLVSDSDGGKINNPNFLKKSLRKLRVSQRAADRKKKGSKRRRKAINRVSKIYEKIQNQRLDYNHKTARFYVNKYDNIFLEDLTTSAMLKNHNLARSISDASWAALRRIIESKAESAGKKVISVPPHYTSQWCSSCGEIVQKSLSVRTHICPHCGYADCRDTNAAKNILKIGEDLAFRESTRMSVHRTEKPCEKSREDHDNTPIAKV